MVQNNRAPSGSSEVGSFTLGPTLTEGERERESRQSSLKGDLNE